MRINRLPAARLSQFSQSLKATSKLQRTTLRFAKERVWGDLSKGYQVQNTQKKNHNIIPIHTFHILFTLKTRYTSILYIYDTSSSLIRNVHNLHLIFFCCSFTTAFYFLYYLGQWFKYVKLFVLFVTRIMIC